MSLSSERWVDVRRASAISGITSLSRIRALARSGEVVARRVIRATTQWERRNLRGLTRRETWELYADSLRAYVADATTRRPGPKPGRRNPHPPGCECAAHRGEGLREHLAFYMTRSMRERLAVAAREMNISQAEVVRTALEQFLG